MTLFSRIPVVSPSKGLATISEADVDYLVDYEPTSYDHWIFSKGSAAGLVGVNAGRSLTPQSAVPTYSANFLTIDGGIGKALLTDMTETADVTRTMCVVVRDPYSGGAIRVPFGTLDSVNNTGGSPFISGSTYPRPMYTTYRNITNSQNTGMTVDKALWLFLAVSIDFSGATKYVRSLVGGQAGIEVTATTAYAASANKVAVGNGYYSGAAAGPMDFAEVITYAKALTLAELRAVYARRKARLAKLGVAVV